MYVLNIWEPNQLLYKLGSWAGHYIYVKKKKNKRSIAWVSQIHNCNTQNSTHIFHNFFTYSPNYSRQHTTCIHIYPKKWSINIQQSVLPTWERWTPVFYIGPLVFINVNWSQILLLKSWFPVLYVFHYSLSPNIEHFGRGLVVLYQIRFLKWYVWAGPLHREGISFLLLNVDLANATLFLWLLPSVFCNFDKHLVLN